MSKKSSRRRIAAKPSDEPKSPYLQTNAKQRPRPADCVWELQGWARGIEELMKKPGSRGSFDQIVFRRHQSANRSLIAIERAYPTTVRGIYDREQDAIRAHEAWCQAPTEQNSNAYAEAIWCLWQDLHDAISVIEGDEEIDAEIRLAREQAAASRQPAPPAAQTPHEPSEYDPVEHGLLPIEAALAGLFARLYQPEQLLEESGLPPPAHEYERQLFAPMYGSVNVIDRLRQHAAGGEYSPEVERIALALAELLKRSRGWQEIALDDVKHNQYWIRKREAETGCPGICEEWYGAPLLQITYELHDRTQGIQDDVERLKRILLRKREREALASQLPLASSERIGLFTQKSLAAALQFGSVRAMRLAIAKGQIKAVHRYPDLLQGWEIETDGLSTVQLERLRNAAGNPPARKPRGKKQPN